jgi:ATP-dependent Clp protease ATP-binding subunit ClpC
MAKADVTVAASLAFAAAEQEATALRLPAIDADVLFIGACNLELIEELGGSDRLSLSRLELVELQDELARFRRAAAEAKLDPTQARRRMRRLATEGVAPLRPSPDERPRRTVARVFLDELRATSPRVTLLGLLRALVDKPTPHQTTLLGEMGVDRADLVAKLAAHDAPIGTASGGVDRDKSRERRGDGPLARFGRDLTAEARKGALPVVTGRAEEIKDVARVLIQTKKSNPVLVGEAGVGKTAIVEGLAVQLLSEDLPPALKGLRLVELSVGDLVAGTKYRGEFEERMQALLTELERDKSIVLFIDEIHLLLGAGAGSGSPMDAANLLKPALARGGIRLIGATTHDEYRKYIEQDAALERRFQPIVIGEPDRETTLAILAGQKAKLEQEYQIEIADDAFAAAVDLSIRHLPNRRLPDKAIDTVNQACALLVLETFSPAARARKLVLERATIVAALAKKLGVPASSIDAGQDDGSRLLELEKVLGERVFGQDGAIRAVSEQIRAAKSGFKRRGQPLGVFLFLGPTGTGKTELAKALAEAMFGSERKLLTFDMSEYAEKHAALRLVGAPPSYVGFEEGGQLTNAVRANPAAVVLFDEIEKAHSDVFDLFLQIFEEGHLTDGRGRPTSFEETIIVMTSNAGSGAPPAAARRAPRPIGFGAKTAPAAPPPGDAGRRAEAAVAALFRPEIRNRIHREILFRPLDAAAFERILDKIVERLGRAQDIAIELERGARALLLERGDEAFGARALERAVTELVAAPLSRLLLERQVRPGDRVVVEVERGALVLRKPGTERTLGL